MEIRIVGGGFRTSIYNALNMVNPFDKISTGSAVGFRIALLIGQNIQLDPEIENPISFEYDGVLRNTLSLSTNSDVVEFTFVPIVYDSNLYLVLTTPVTNKQWNCVCELPVINEYISPVSQYRFLQRPVTNISYVNAEEFCNRLSIALNIYVFIPGIDLWKYCATCGNMPVNLNSYEANLNNLNGFTSTVMNYSPNNWGFYDCFGNVWEMVTWP